MRNEEGDLIRAFWCKSEQTNIDAVEMEAVVHGLQICDQIGIGNLRIETDSIAVVKVAHGSSKNPTLIYTARKNGLRGRAIFQINREENGVADLLAKDAKSSEDGEFQLINQLPINIRTAIYLDKIGLHKFRKGKASSG
ncbi:hypothetical protein CASFOL_038976 [Castilleja foliolosa]|uniref:RNase H type-1 domain-containing protein n=1 Tax=Castilleja foliolosa TaxID=1961234 RepID=A0ABD3BJ41_9LAMI